MGVPHMTIVRRDSGIVTLRLSDTIYLEGVAKVIPFTLGMTMGRFRLRCVTHMTIA